MVVIHPVSVTPRFPLPSSSARPLNTGFNGTSSVSFFLKKHPLSRKIFSGKQSAEFDSSSQAIAASEKVLVPDNLDNAPTSFSEQPQGFDLEIQTMEENEAVRTEDQVSVFDSSKVFNDANIVKERGLKPRTLPPPGDGKKICEIDPMLLSYRDHPTKKASTH